MDKELIDLMVKLKLESNIQRILVDTILDSTYLSYNGKELRVDDGDKILTVLKTFYGDEVDNRLKQLKEKDEKEESDNG